ncbi:hypothetical protein ACJVC5_15805 [Peredibacter sp. HCB2-198]|uniref:hypothetical protein n=1 Tax=Peredibacter sp. HCB2-198 TaxID=3383025 RepID=UPI0038B65D9A
MKRVFMHKIASLSISCLLAFSASAEVIAPQSKLTYGDVVRKQSEEMNCGRDYVGTTELADLAVQCWEQKKTEATHPGLSQREYLESDKLICDCLGKSPYKDIKDIMAKGSRDRMAQNADEALKYFYENMGLAQKRLQDLQNGMMFQASILSKGDTSFTEAYSQGRMRKILEDSSTNTPAKEEKVVQQVLAIKGKALDSLAEKYVENKGLNSLKVWINPEMRQDKGSLVNGLKEAMNNFVLPQADITLLTNKEMAPGQCVSAREYLAFKQIPKSDSSFFTQLKGSEFRIADWDYNLLETELQRLSDSDRKTNESRISVIRSRMGFLNRNPMIKNFFNVSLQSNEAYFKSAGLSSKEQADVINNPAWTPLQAHKEKLFNIIKNLDPSKRKSVEEFREKSTAFFSDPQVGYLTNLEVEKSYYRELEKLKDPNNLKPPKLPTTQKGLEAWFADKTDLLSPSECKAGAVDVAKCVESYAMYCSVLSDAEKQMKEEDIGAEDLTSDVTFQNLDNFDPDINKNPDFKRFNDKACNARWVSHTPGKRPLNFFEYKNEFCKTNAANEACRARPSNESMVKLRQSFRQEYTEIERSENKLADKQEMDALENVTEAYNASTGMSESNAKSVANSKNSLERSKTLLNEITELFGGSRSNLKDDANNEVVNVVPTSSEGSTFSSFARGMENLASSMGGVAGVAPVEDVSPQFLGSSSITPSAASTANDDKKLTDDEKERIRAEAQEEILKSKKEIAAATSAAQRESLEARMKMMEDLLAQKTENEAKYQKLIEQLSKKTSELAEAENKVAASTKSEKAIRRPASNNFQANQDFDSFDNQSNRSPSSYGDSSYGGTAGGTAGGSTGGSGGSSARVSSTTRGSSRAAGNFNTALLEAQEAKTGKIQKSSDGMIVVASDAETPVLKSMGNAVNGASDYAINVPAADYMGFESQNVETLKRYQEKILNSMDSNQPVRMVVKSDKKEPLEFYVVKEGSKLFFKPVRKSGATLEALKMAVKKNP